MSRWGSIDWLCLPDFSSPSVFARLLDPARGGAFSVRPRSPFTSRRRYLDGSAVLETEFVTATGVARMLDFFPMDDGVATLSPMREVLRIVEGKKGVVDFEVNLEVRPDYAASVARPCQRGRLGWVHAWRNETLALHADAALQAAANGVSGGLSVAAGERKHFSLSYTKGDPAVVPALGAAADERLTRTIAWWRDWAAQCRYDGRHREAVVRSVVTLKLLHYAPSGAIVAAPTTSLPEALGGSRNWDYRYCWLRDAGLTNQALLSLGYADEARSFLGWLLHATRLTWPELRIMYDVFGRTGLAERDLPHLAGHRNSPPVRVGNGAHRQRQLDVYGEVVVRRPCRRHTRRAPGSRRSSPAGRSGRGGVQAMAPA